MKKIISLLAATMMIFSFASMASANTGIDVAISDANVAVGAIDDAAKVDVTYTFTFPEEISLIGFQPEITFDKEALTLNSYTLSGEGVTWTTSDSNTNATYGAYLSFDDTDFVGTTATTEYVMTLNFTVNDTSVNGAEYEVGLQNLVGTNVDWAGIADLYTLNSFDNGIISVGTSAPDKTDVEIAGVATADYEKTGLFEKDGAQYYHAAFKKAITVDKDSNNPVAGIKIKGDKEATVTFKTAIEDGTVNVAINILDVPVDVTLGALTITPFAN